VVGGERYSIGFVECISWGFKKKKKKKKKGGGNGFVRRGGGLGLELYIRVVEALKGYDTQEVGRSMSYR
jgi:hypothetical protein